MDNEAPQVSPMNQEGDPCTAEEVVDHPMPAGRAAPPGLGWYLRSVEEVLRYLGALQRREEAGQPVRIRIGEATPQLFRLWPARRRGRAWRWTIAAPAGGWPSRIRGRT